MSRNRRPVSRIDLRRVAAGRSREVLPAIEVDMGFQIGLPRIFHGGLEGHDEHTRGAQLLRELIGGKGLAEAHFCVPQGSAERRVRPLSRSNGSRRASCPRPRPARGASETSRDGCPSRSSGLVWSSVTAVFTSSGAQRIHSRDEPMTTFSKPLSIRRWRTSLSRNSVPSFTLGEGVDVQGVSLLHLPWDWRMRSFTSSASSGPP